MNNDIEQLRKQVERRVGYPLLSTRDFNLLSTQIYTMLGIQVSSTTLKRLWGYVEKDITRQPRMFTLNSLARYIGYDSFEHFQRNFGTATECESNFLNASSLHVRDLAKGTKLSLQWNPDRNIIIRFEGEDLFTVVEAENCKLSVGDQFHATNFVQGEPLIVNNVLHHNEQISNYVCGQKNGIHYEIIHHML